MTQNGNSSAVDIIGKVTAKAQADADFRSQYVKNPKEVLAEAGLNIPDDVRVHIIVGNPTNGDIPSSTAHDVYLVVPQVSEHIGDQSLASAASASCTGTASTCFCLPSTASCASTASTQSCS